MSWLALVDVAVGDPGAAGTVVIVTETASDASDVPAALVAVTVIELLPTGSPVIVIGDEDPVAVCVPLVTVYEVAAGLSPGIENETTADPLL